MLESPPKPRPDSRPSDEFIRAVRARVATVVVGQDAVVERLLVALFTGSMLTLALFITFLGPRTRGQSLETLSP